MDPALPWIDPERAAEYGSFRFGLRKGAVLDYPARDSRAFLERISEKHDPRAILLSPILAAEYTVVRTLFPEAWILGMGLPESSRTITAVWDPVPSSREAGQRAGAFLLAGEKNRSDHPEAVLVSIKENPGQEPAETAFLEGLHSMAPGISHRFLFLSEKPEVEELEELVQDLSAYGRRAIFLNAGSYGIKAARALDAHRKAPEPDASANVGLFVVLRLTERAATRDAPADILIAGDTRVLLAAFRQALKSAREAALVIPEPLTVRAGVKQ